MQLRYRTIFAFLVGLYFLATGLTWMTERGILAVSPGEGALRITLRHFRQPTEWGITPQSLRLFFDEVTRGKPGIFGSFWLYATLLGSYLILNAVLLVRTTRSLYERTDDAPTTGVGIDFMLRYAPIVDKLSGCAIDARILEIGSGVIGVAPFVDKHTVIGIDSRSMKQAIAPHNLQLVQASAMNAPFADNSFDYVLCVDVLEHVPSADRDGLIKEALRITKGTLFIATPSGVRTAQAERLLYAVLAPLYRAFEKDLSFLREHLENGLPEREDLLRVITSFAPGAQISIRRNVNLCVWMLCMSVDPFVRWATKRTGIAWLRGLLWPIAPLLSFGPGYRLVFAVSKVAHRNP
jgi:SAM-dependent methyltransferase